MALPPALEAGSLASLEELGASLEDREVSLQDPPSASLRAPEVGSVGLTLVTPTNYSSESSSSLV